MIADRRTASLAAALAPRKLVAYAALLAGLYVLWITLVPNQPISDQRIYYDEAVRLHEGRGYVDDSGRPTGYWAPGYSFYLAGVFRVLGVSYRSAFVGNLAAALALAIGIYFLGRKLYGARTAAVASLAAAAYPTFIIYTTVIASEVLFTALVAWGLFFMAQCATGKRWVHWAALAGVVMGAASFTRPQAMILGLALLAWPAPWGTRVVRALVVSMFLFLSLLPWGLRNERQLGSFVWVSANGGPNLWIGNHPGASGGYEDFDRVTSGHDLEHKSLVERDVHLRRLAREYIASHPFEYLQLCVKRIGITFRSESSGVVWNEVGLTQTFGQASLPYFKTLTNTAYLGLCIFLVHAFYRRRVARDGLPADPFVFIALALLALPSVLILGASRFHLPMAPFAILFASSRWVARTPAASSAVSTTC